MDHPGIGGVCRREVLIRAAGVADTAAQVLAALAATTERRIKRRLVLIPGIHGYLVIAAGEI